MSYSLAQNLASLLVLFEGRQNGVAHFQEVRV